ncbi:50S ribosomal protein L9, partial [Christensenellaceae bacterium OttesenSCG-928-M15]|nr:50S ribosomal protein L9 [Christensenellaceae bacterium OttesenSCG-928-M15]
MKVLLEQDVKGTGKQGQIVEVSDGYARNFLLPRKLASPADAASINAANIRKSAAQHKKFQAGVNAREQAKKLEGQKVVIAVRVGENGKLFGAVTSKEIAAALKEQHGLEVDRKKIMLAEPIRAAGTQNVTVRLFEGTDATFIVEVVG